MSSTAELRDLVAVHDFALKIIEHALGHAVPVPEKVSEALNTEAKNDAEPRAEFLRRWLALLDLAITPPMVRDALHAEASPEHAEAVLRYFVRKQSPVDIDRDKADFVATYLYRQYFPLKNGDVPDMAAQFEERLKHALSGFEIAPLGDGQRRTVAEFEFIRQEVEDFRHFDGLMDSGIVQRVRDIKQALAQAFYHPHTLATIASYNVFFGNRFDQLFRDAAGHIKTFAAKAQQEGASVLSRVDGDVTVKHLADVGDDTGALHLEYGRAQEHFRKVSHLKKVVDKKKSGHGNSAAAAVATSSGSGSGTSLMEPRPGAAMAPMGQIDQLQEGKIRMMTDRLREAVRKLDPNAPAIVPMPHGNIVLSPAEAEACRGDYLNEKSVRADWANALVSIVALQTCIAVELREYFAKKTSAHLWRPHADSLRYLLASANREMERGQVLVTTAHQRGLTEKVNQMKATLDKFRNNVQQAASAVHF